MPILYDPVGTGLCVFLGFLMLIGRVFMSQKSEEATGKRILYSMLPAMAAVLAARGGYALLWPGEKLSVFPCCWTLGLAGTLAGMLPAARSSRKAFSTFLDQAISGVFLCLLLIRLGQRWLGPSAVGPCLEKDSPIAHTPLVLLNEWGEPLLAVFWPEALAALASLLIARAECGRNGTVPGVASARSLTVLLVAQILLEQLRTGDQARWGMVRGEQVLCALGAFGILVTLCVRSVRSGRITIGRAVALPLLFLSAAGLMALCQFILDGKLPRIPTGVCLALYPVAALWMAALVFAASGRPKASVEGGD